MTAIHVTDIKSFMTLLFSGDGFDRFLFVEGDISTAVDYHICGRINMNFYTDEELDELKLEEFQTWGATKELVKTMIKGKRLPVSMKFVLKKDGKENITYLLNIRFDNNNLVLITGITRELFTLDKSGEKEWDMNVTDFLTRNNIDFTIME